MLCPKVYMMPEDCPPSWELIVCIGPGMHRVASRDGCVPARACVGCVWVCVAPEDGVGQKRFCVWQWWCH